MSHSTYIWGIPHSTKGLSPVSYYSFDFTYSLFRLRCFVSVRVNLVNHFPCFIIYSPAVVPTASQTEEGKCTDIYSVCFFPDLELLVRICRISLTHQYGFWRVVIGWSWEPNFIPFYSLPESCFFPCHQFLNFSKFNYPILLLLKFLPVF